MIWYPYEQMKTMKAPYKIIKAKGVHLYTEDQELIDSVSSWWCMIHGYKHPELTAAIKEQEREEAGQKRHAGHHRNAEGRLSRR